MRKSKPYNIDYIVSSQNNNNNNNNDNDKSDITKDIYANSLNYCVVGGKSEIGMANGNCVIKNEKTESFDGAKREITDPRDNQNVTEKTLGYNSYGSDYKYQDFGSSEVKHARTPISNVPPTHSPQLPIPSPNYPVQTQLTTETICSASLTTITTSGCESNYQQNKHVDTNIPNTYVPTINNNYISAPHHTSQNEIQQTNATTTDIAYGVVIQENEASSKHQNATTNVVAFDEISNTNQKINLHYDETKTKYNYKNNFKSNNNNISNKENSQFTVLNVPNFNCQTSSTRKPKLSKIDLAIVKRKRRRQNKHVKMNNSITTENNKTSPKYSYDFGVKVYGYSDSSSSNSCSSSECESDSEVDLWIKSGPPCKLDVKPEKVNFLQGFGLTTFNKRNCKIYFFMPRFVLINCIYLIVAVELEKLERRKWQPPWKSLETNTKNDILDLPVPSQSPSVLNTCHDSQQKNYFLNLLGLKNVPSYIRNGM